MSTTRPWDRAASLPIPADGRARPQLAALSPGLPSVETLFTFARDAELRFETLRMRIEDRSWTANGEDLTVIDLALRHPGDVRLTTTRPSLGTAGAYEIWVSDGEVVRTYSAPHKVGTERPARTNVVGLEDPDLPGTSMVYRPLTALPREIVADTFVHPAGYCQNVLGTGRCWVSGSAAIGGREAIVLDCDHPRTIGIAADRPDHHLEVTFDRETGVILRLRQTIGGGIAREAVVVDLAPNATLAPATFEFTLPSDATLIY